MKGLHTCVAVFVGKRAVGIIMEGNRVVQVILERSSKALSERLRRMNPRPLTRRSAKIEKSFKNYLQGRTCEIKVPFELGKMTRLQEKILLETRKIPFGKSVSYGMIAGKVGNRRLARVVGSALAKNPIPLIIPCHRVIAADGGLGGFMGDPEDKSGWKKLLLLHESQSSRQG